MTTKPKETDDKATDKPMTDEEIDIEQLIGCLPLSSGIDKFLERDRYEQIIRYPISGDVLNKMVAVLTRLKAENEELRKNMQKSYRLDGWEEYPADDIQDLKDYIHDAADTDGEEGPWWVYITEWREAGGIWVAKADIGLRILSNEEARAALKSGEE